MKILINNNKLDLFETDVEFTFKSLRFSKGLSEGFSNDFTLPLTINNIKLLKLGDVLNQPKQPFEDKLKGTLIVGSNSYSIDIEIVEILENEVEICCYQRLFPTIFKEKYINRLIEDDNSSIFIWFKQSKEYYPNNFTQYGCGSKINNDYYQIHPSFKLNTIIEKLEEKYSYKLPRVEDDIYLVAGNKCVCPQNKRQVLSYYTDSTKEDNLLRFGGGQHIVNDSKGYDGLSPLSESSDETLTFNRKCKTNTTIWLNYRFVRHFYLTTKHFIVKLYKNDVVIWTYDFYGRNNVYYNQDLLTFNVEFEFDENDTLEIKVFEIKRDGEEEDAQKLFDYLQIILDNNYIEYEIDENDDYGDDLTYCNRLPSIYWYDLFNNEYKVSYFDGGSIRYYNSYNDGTFNSLSTIYKTIQFPVRGYSYFGYYSSLMDFKVNDLYYNLCWIFGYNYSFNDKALFFTPSNRTKIIDGKILSKTISSKNIGQKTYIKYKDEEIKKIKPIITVSNTVLEEEKTLFDSIFNSTKYTRIGLIVDQYSYEEDGDDKNCSYNKTRDFLGRIQNNTIQFPFEINVTTRIPTLNSVIGINDLGLKEVTQSIEVEIETKNTDIENYDYVYLDGRKYLIIEVSKNLNDNTFNIKALLIQ